MICFRMLFALNGISFDPVVRCFFEVLFERSASIFLFSRLQPDIHSDGLRNLLSPALLRLSCFLRFASLSTLAHKHCGVLSSWWAYHFNESNAFKHISHFLWLTSYKTCVNMKIGLLKGIFRFCFIIKCSLANGTHDYGHFIYMWWPDEYEYKLIWIRIIIHMYRYDLRIQCAVCTCAMHTRYFKMPQKNVIKRQRQRVRAKMNGSRNSNSGFLNTNITEITNDLRLRTLNTFSHCLSLDIVICQAYGSSFSGKRRQSEN